MIEKMSEKHQGASMEGVRNFERESFDESRSLVINFVANSHPNFFFFSQPSSQFTKTTITIKRKKLLLRDDGSLKTAVKMCR